MNLLRMLIDSDDKKMVDNYRPLQGLNDRTVYSSFNASTGTPPTSPTEMKSTVKAHATAVSMTAALLLLMLVAAIFMH